MRILYIAARQPYPVVKGDQRISYEQIRKLSRHNEVYLFSFYRDELEKLESVMGRYCEEMFLFKEGIVNWAAMGRSVVNFKPLQMNYYYSRRLKRKLEEVIERINPDVVHVQGFRMAEYLMESGLNKVIDIQDAYSLNMYKRFEKAGIMLKPVCLFEYLMLKRYEKKILLNYEKKTVVTVRDREYLDDDSIIVNPNGTGFFDERSEAKQLGAFKEFENSVVFHGNMSYYPNVEAAKYLIGRIFPRVRRRYPGSKLYIVGANPSRELLDMKGGQGVVITGYVDDVREYLAKAAVSAVPVFSATGIQNKVLEAMAMKVPCVISRECFEGIEGLEEEKNVLVASNDEEFERQIARLIDDEDLRRGIIASAYRLISERYTWDSNVETLERLYMR